MIQGDSQGSFWSSQDEFWPIPEPVQGLSLQESEQQHIEQLFLENLLLPPGKILKISSLNGYCAKNFKVTYIHESGQTQKIVFKLYRHLRRLPLNTQHLNKLLIHLNKFQNFKHFQKPLPLKIHEKDDECLRVVFDGFWKQLTIVRAFNYVQGITLQTFLQNSIPESSTWSDSQAFQKLIDSFADTMGKLNLQMDQFYQQNKANLRVFKKKGYKWISESFKKWGKHINETIYPDKQDLNLLKYAVLIFERNIFSHNSPKLKRTWIHNDANTGNVLLNKIVGKEEYQISIIDFDDSNICQRIAEISICLSSMLEQPIYYNLDQYLSGERGFFDFEQIVLKLVKRFVKKYHCTYPLDEDEIECFYYFLYCRIANLSAYTEKQKSEIVGYEDIEKSCKSYKIFLKHFLQINPKKFENNIRVELGWPLSKKPPIYPHISFIFDGLRDKVERKDILKEVENERKWTEMVIEHPEQDYSQLIFDRYQSRCEQKDEKVI